MTWFCISRMSELDRAGASLNALSLSLIIVKGSNVHVTRFCLCCCCCNPSVRKNALLTRLSVRILHSPCFCVVPTRLLSRERSSLCACFRVTQLVLFCCPSLPQFRWNHAESRVTQEQACCASSRTTGGATRSRNRGAEKAPHFASRILSPWSNDAERSKATERVEMWRVPALDLGWVQMLVLRFDGTERTNPRGRCKSGECLQRGHHSDSAASRESAEEHECWSSGSCKRCDFPAESRF